jgi:DDE superfamily endonuclease
MDGCPATAARTQPYSLAWVRRGWVRVGRRGGDHEGRLRETYVEWVLAPSLSPGQVMVLDNPGAHKGGRVRGLIEERGCSLLFLPPYSPDFSPIEEAFSKVKTLLRKAAARTRGALVEAMGRALDAVTVQDIRGWFGHCGYRLDAQSS